MLMTLKMCAMRLFGWIQLLVGVYFADSRADIKTMIDEGISSSPLYLHNQQLRAQLGVALIISGAIWAVGAEICSALERRKRE